jgi:prophage antirepressor-like protein
MKTLMITPEYKSNELSITDLPIFKSDLTADKELRVLGTYNEPWFIGKDIALFLGYKDTDQALRKNIDNEDKISFKEFKNMNPVAETGLKIQDSTVLINESGMYSLAVSSKLPNAKVFKRWVTSEVLPAIRKTGEYINEELKNRIMEMERTLAIKNTEINDISKDYKKLTRNHNNLKLKRSYYQFKKKDCFYIVENDWVKTQYYKIGMTDDINDRLQTYRTAMPNVKIRYLIFTNKNKLVEDMVKARYESDFIYLNHEYIHNVKLSDIILSITKLVKYLRIKHVVEDNLNMYNEEDDDLSDDESEKVEEIKDDESESDKKAESEEESDENEESDNNESENEESDNENDEEDNVEVRDIYAYKLTTEEKKKYQEMFKNIEEDKYLKREMQKIMSELELPTTGTKTVLGDKLKVRINEMITETRECNECKNYKNFVHYREFERKGYSHTCIECERSNEYKVCQMCNKEKLKTEFNKDRSRKDGLEYRCKKCDYLRKSEKRHR